ncbi:hypothetical protein LINPERPRIM_LOCUS39597 [Linum perenne]
MNNTSFLPIIFLVLVVFHGSSSLIVVAKPMNCSTAIYGFQCYKSVCNKDCIREFGEFAIGYCWGRDLCVCEYICDPDSPFGNELLSSI